MSRLILLLQLTLYLIMAYCVWVAVTIVQPELGMALLLSWLAFWFLYVVEKIDYALRMRAMIREFMSLKRPGGEQHNTDSDKPEDIKK